MSNPAPSENVRKVRFATLAAVGILYPAGALFAAVCSSAMFSGTGLI